MQSVSPSPRATFDVASGLGRVRSSLGEGRAWSFLLVLLLTLTVAESTSSFHWVDGIEVVVPIGLLGAALMGALALTPLAESIALAVGVVAGVPLAVLGAWPQIHHDHQTAQLGLPLLNLWSSGVSAGWLASDQSFYLVWICLLMWVTGAWLAWCTLRWRRPMLGLIPGAAAFSTNALNILPGMPDQNGFALAMIVLIIALLLWNNYASSVLNAVRAHIRLTGDAKWDFWESGLVAMLVVLVLSIFMPQMSKTDRTMQIESSIFTGWAQLQSEISHPGLIGQGAGGGTTGFSGEAKLAGSISKDKTPVFLYQQVGAYGGPIYFTGLILTQQSNGEWRVPKYPQTFPIQENKPIQYAERYDALGPGGFTVKMTTRIAGYPTLLFHPGQLAKIDRPASAREGPLLGFHEAMVSMDRLDATSTSAASSYAFITDYSGATAAQLQAAGTDYPDWVKPFASTSPEYYRSPDVLAYERNLAESIVAEANVTTPYDEATAIESYLRSPRFHYSLTADTPQGEDPLYYFLNKSRTGYCVYFATAMGDMLRELGIPTRLVNGFGAGTFESSAHSYMVRAQDAHTWVEAYFPGYGWIPFEPTPDSSEGFNTIARGSNPGAVCQRENGCDSPDNGDIPVIGGTGPASPGTHQKNTTSGGSRGGFSVARIVGPNLFNYTVAALLAVVLLLLLLGVRYLRPRTVAAVWNRTLMLASIAGAERRPGETPLELGRRLQRVFPEAAEPVAALASGFAVAAYAPAEVAADARTGVMEAWTALRPHLLRRVLARLRPSSL